MASVGILTFHYSINYGAVLQAVALARVLRKMGHAPEVIDYRNLEARRALVPVHRRVAHYVWRDVLGRLMVGDERRIRTERFRCEEMPLSAQSYDWRGDLLKAPDIYDVYLVGSDQVWNLDHTRGNTAYLLDFVSRPSRCVSYAASLGHDGPSQRNLNLLREHLHRFDAVSVREVSAVEVLAGLGVPQAKLVLDPTMLLSGEDWSKLASPSTERGDYLLVYHMPGDRLVNERMRHLSDRIARQTGWRVVHIGQDQARALRRGEDNRFDAGPREFLSLMRGASGVITNSFHGTAFAITMEKPFFTVYRRPGSAPTARSGRQISLLSLAALESQGLNVDDALCDEGHLLNEFEVDFGEARQRIATARARSLEYLANAIQ